MAATAEITLDMTGANGQTMDVVAKLIEKRWNVLGGDARDATIATVITALKSLRKLTRKHKGGVQISETPKEKLSISLELTHFQVTFHKNHNKYGLRHSVTKLDSDIKPAWYIPPVWSLRKNAEIYRVRLSDDRIEAWPHQKGHHYIVVSNYQKGVEIVEKKFGKIVKNYSTMANSTIGKCMELVSSRPVHITNKPKALKVVIDNAKVQKSANLGNTFSSFEETGEFFIDVHDSLRFATDALDGGANAVNMALMRAANAVNGMINKALERDTDFFAIHGIHKEERPFPESMFEPEAEISS